MNIPSARYAAIDFAFDGKAGDRHVIVDCTLKLSVSALANAVNRTPSRRLIQRGDIALRYWRGPHRPERQGVRRANSR